MCRWLAKPYPVETIPPQEAPGLSTALVIGVFKANETKVLNYGTVSAAAQYLETSMKWDSYQPDNESEFCCQQ
jgi:hypothetical protein